MSSSRPHCTGDECRHEDPPEDHEDNIFASERTRRPTPAPAALDEPLDDTTTTDPDTTTSSSASDTDSTGQADESSTSLSCTPDENGVIASSMTSTAPSSTPLQQQQSVLYAYQVELEKSAPDSTLPSVLSLLERRISQHALAPALLNDECDNDEGTTTTTAVAANNNDTPSTRHLQESDVLLISTDPPDQVMEGEPCLNINSSFCWVVSGEATIYSSPTVLSSTQLLLAQDTIRKSMTKHSDLYYIRGDSSIVSISYRQDIVERQVLMNNNNNNDMNNQSSNNNTGIIVGCILLSFGLICMVGGVLYLLYWRRHMRNNNSTDNLVPLGIEAHEYDSTYDLQPLEKSFESGEHPLNTSWDELWNNGHPNTSRNDDDLLLIGIPPRGLEHNNNNVARNNLANNFIMMDRPATNHDDREYDTDEYIHEVPKSIVTTTASYTTHSSSSSSWGESIQNDLLMDVDDCSSISSGSLYVNEEGDSRKKKKDKAHNSIEIGIV